MNEGLTWMHRREPAGPFLLVPERELDLLWMRVEQCRPWYRESVSRMREEEEEG